jgi:hypothetical protein
MRPQSKEVVMDATPRSPAWRCIVSAAAQTQAAGQRIEGKILARRSRPILDAQVVWLGRGRR